MESNRRLLPLLLVILPLLLLIGPAFADQAGIRYGLGVGVKEANSVADIKAFSAFYSTPVFSLFSQKFEGGLWVDPHGGTERSSSAFGSYSLGVRVDNPSFYAAIYWGAGLITHRDSRLGSNNQFFNDAVIGFKDSAERHIGLSYKHISNAGLSSPNKGRDFIMLETSIPWSFK